MIVTFENGSTKTVTVYKQCKRCSAMKDGRLFSKSRKTQDGVMDECKSCRKAVARKRRAAPLGMRFCPRCEKYYRVTNSGGYCDDCTYETRSVRDKRSYEKNKAKKIQYQIMRRWELRGFPRVCRLQPKRWSDLTPEQKARWYEKRKERWGRLPESKKREIRKRYDTKHGPKKRERLRNLPPEKKAEHYKNVYARQKERRAKDPNARIAHALRQRLNSIVRDNRYNKTKTIPAIGCRLSQLRKHLESQFKPGMSWANYGGSDPAKGWHIDHIRPCSSFDMSDLEQQRQCFHYTNLQPMWGTDNLRKGAKWKPSRQNVK